MNISVRRDGITGNEFSIDTTKHINISGMSGIGKSTLLVSLFIEHIRQGNGALFIDPPTATPSIPLGTRLQLITPPRRTLSP
jgi:ABC-type phosphate/phosphonate transport system ATPase subunit